tara:strand:+ start:13 stop:426 length:414 start_codon:yes stop_codon:yes gene_type:complete
MKHLPKKQTTTSEDFDLNNHPLLALKVFERSYRVFTEGLDSEAAEDAEADLLVMCDHIQEDLTVEAVIIIAREHPLLESEYSVLDHICDGWSDNKHFNSDDELIGELMNGVAHELWDRTYDKMHELQAVNLHQRGEQ